MFSSVLRWVSQKGAAAKFSCRRTSAGIFRSPNSCSGSKLCGRMMSTMRVSDQSSTNLPSRISPWLMLPPPASGGNDNVYRFYSIAERKELSISKGCGDDDAKFVGSSHGWLALLNPHNCELFLLNPLSRRHIKLPPIHTLPIPEDSLKDGSRCVRKVIISCSPNEEQEECRAMMIFGPENRLAFCWPGHSTEWTPAGKITTSYEDIVYSRSHKLFFCITDYHHLEGWDLSDPLAPRMEEDLDFDVRIEKQVAWFKSHRVAQLKYLVAAEQSNELLLVTRHIIKHLSPWGYYVQSADHSYPYKTTDFDVLKIDRKERKLRHMEGSLEGLAMFIGTNHSFTVLASEFPELERDSIFFTDENKLIPPNWPSLPYSVPDIDIFNYGYRLFYSDIFSCRSMRVSHYKHGYVCDAQIMKRLPPLPMWFTPSLH